MQLVQPTPGILLTAPYDGVITEWRVAGSAQGGNSLQLRVLRRSGSQFAGVGTSGGVTASPGDGIPAHPVSMAIRQGDYIGVDTVGVGGNTFVYHSIPNGTSTVGFWAGGLPDGPLGDPPFGNDGERLQMQATVLLDRPAISGLSPASGSTAGGETVTITGDHFADATGVQFGTAAAAITSISNTQITVTAPAHADATVDVAVTTSRGTSPATNADHYVYGTGGAGGVEGVGGGPPDTTRPSISAFSLAPSTFVAANSGPGIVEAAAVGTQVVYRLSEPAATTLTVDRRRPGIRRGRRCVAGRPRKGRKRCTRYVAVRGSLVRLDVAGLNAFRFMGRINGKSLQPGRYRLNAVARDPAHNESARMRRSFRIVR